MLVRRYKGSGEYSRDRHRVIRLILAFVGDSSFPLSQVLFLALSSPIDQSNLTLQSSSLDELFVLAGVAHVDLRRELASTRWQSRLPLR